MVSSEIRLSSTICDVLVFPQDVPSNNEISNPYFIFGVVIHFTCPAQRFHSRPAKERSFKISVIDNKVLGFIFIQPGFESCLDKNGIVAKRHAPGNHET